MPINWKGIKTTGNRFYDANRIAEINDSLQYLPAKQRAAVIGTIIEESGGDPLARSEKGTYQGLLQWGADRYKIQSNDARKELANQLSTLRSTINNTTDKKSWSHGGIGSGYNSFQEAYDTFHDKDAPLEDVYRAFSFGYVRPKGKEASYKNRLEVTKQVYPKVLADDVVKNSAKAVGIIGDLMHMNEWKDGGAINNRPTWDKLSMAEKADVMKLAIEGGVYDLDAIRSGYNEFAEGGSKKEEVEVTTSPSNSDIAMTAMMKSKLATAAHYGNPTARRMTNYDTRSYIWPNEYEYSNGIGEPRRGNVFVGSYDNLVTPQIQDIGDSLEFVDDVWSPENDRRSYMQSIKFDNPRDAQYFGEHYKEIAPMMNLYNDGGHKIHIKPENRGKFTALKERTGHSATWFKEHGTPAQKKMATFALNARHWKHGDGGNLFEGGGRKLEYHPEGDYYYGGIPFKVTVTGKNKKKRPYWVSPKGAGNMTVMPGDPEMVFFAPIAAGAAITAAPAIGSVLGNTMTGINAASDAVAATAAGQRLTSGLNFMSKAVGNSKAWPWMDAGLTSAFAAHGLNHAINEGIDGWGDAAMTALEVAPLGRLAKPMLDAGKQGLQYTTKAVDNATRYVSPSYDLYRTVGETTPSVRVRDPYVNVKGLEGINKSYIKIKSSLEDLTDAKRGIENEAYYLFAPKDIDILKLRNARFGNGNAYDGPILSSGSVDGKFVSYGEPWMEFAPGENRALYEMPTGPRRGSSLMATDFRGNRMDYSVDEAYNAVLRNRQFQQDIKNMELDDILQFKRDNYPDLIGGIPTDIYHANQTVIPNKNWNFDKFLKTPLWKYSEDSASGQVQKELMMRWPEAKPLETSTMEWADATRTPQITAENAASITPEQWTAAQDAAIAKGDMAEAQRLRDLHFMTKAPNTFASINGKPLQLYHGTNNNFNAFDLSKYGSTDGGTFGRGVYTTPIQEYAQLYGKNNMPLYMKLDNPRDYRDYSIGDLIAEKLAFGEDFSTGNGIDGVIGRPSWKGFKGLEEYVSHNPKNIKSSKAVTYDNNGVRIPLGKRDNFKLNDIRYGLLPFGIGLTGYELLNNQEAFGGNIKKRKR